ncbi:hypothetical protein HY546_03180 [archaeon]|nr:hypothetical protein [archaeon]
MKQISLSIPETLFRESYEQAQELGYRSVQEFILDLVRSRVILEKIGRYRGIAERMKLGIGVKKFDQTGALKHLKEL